MSLPPLTPEQLVKPKFFELRMSVVFATLFLSLGFHLPYFPLWLEFHGFDPGEIAVILSAPMFLRVFTTPMITAAADRAGDRAHVYIVMVGMALLLSSGYFLPPGYLVVLAVSLVLTVFWTPHSPIADSLALSGVRRFRSDYPAMRIWGSLSFLAASLSGGFLLSAFGAGSVPVIISAFLAVALAAAFWAPRLGRPRQPSAPSGAGLGTTASVLDRRFVLAVTGGGIINGSHGLLFAFGSIYWSGLGIGDTVMGFLWASAVAAEVVMFLLFTRLFGEVSPRIVMMIAGAAAVVRWLLFPLAWPLGFGLAGFFALQSLHALSTALYLIGVQRLIAESVPEERTGAAQGVAFFANGLAMAAVTLLSGPLYAAVGVAGFYFMAVLAAVGIACLWLASAPKVAAGR